MDFSKFDYVFFDKIASAFIKMPDGEYEIKDNKDKEKLIYHLGLYKFLKPSFMPIVELLDNNKFKITQTV